MSVLRINSGRDLHLGELQNRKVERWPLVTTKSPRVTRSLNPTVGTAVLSLPLPLSLTVVDGVVAVSGSRLAAWEEDDEHFLFHQIGKGSMDSDRMSCGEGVPSIVVYRCYDTYDQQSLFNGRRRSTKQNKRNKGKETF